MTEPNKPKSQVDSRGVDPTLNDAVRQPWRRFTEQFEPLRPELYRYCRMLTRSPWDAEDLVQDTLVRAFMILGTSPSPPEHARAWLFRVASNRWLNQVKRQREELVPEPPQAASAEVNPRGMREAGGSLVGQLAPKERAAVVLKEAFSFTLEEAAEALSTSVGAVKAALHRGREKLKHAEAEPENTPCPAVLDEFCKAFNDRDLERLLSLLLDTAEIELAGTFTGYGKQVAKQAFGGMMFAATEAVAAGIAKQHRGDLLLVPPRFEVRMHRGVPLVLGYFQHDSGQAVRSFARIEWEGDRVTGIRTYLHSPEALHEICSELGVACRSNGYKNW
jgi:RNA polymerase sigma-70 factor (ECF subfamily)